MYAARWPSPDRCPFIVASYASMAWPEQADRPCPYRPSLPSGIDMPTHLKNFISRHKSPCTAPKLSLRTSSNIYLYVLYAPLINKMPLQWHLLLSSPSSSALLVHQREDGLLDIRIANVEVFEVNESCLGFLLVGLLQNGLHGVCASDKEAVDLLLAHAEEYAVALIHRQETALVIVCDYFNVLLEGLRVRICSGDSHILDKLPCRSLILNAIWFDVVALEHVLEVQEVVRVLLGVILLLLLSFHFYFVDFLVAGQVEGCRLVVESDVSCP